jgi:integrase
MPKQVFTDTTARNLKAGAVAARFYDAGCRGLYLEVRPTGAKIWLLRVQHEGKRRDFGLGGYPKVSLAKARSEAEAVRTALREGRDVKAERDAKRAGEREAADRTFEWAAEQWHKNMTADGNRNERTAANWLARMRTYAFPKLGNLRIDRVDDTDVAEALSDLWHRRPETARRVLNGVDKVLRSAAVKKWRGPAPDLQTAITEAHGGQSRKIVHRAAVPWRDAPAVIAALQSKAATTARMALLFTIWTAVRSGEGRGALWGEVDMTAALWTVPAERTKMKREKHRVPLSEPALAILEEMRSRYVMDHDGEPPATAPIFPGPTGEAVSDVALLKANRQVAPESTVHGWRSTFRDWASEATATPHDVCEEALAHAIPNKTEAAYRRDDLLEKRRPLMAAWAAYLTAPPAGDNVVSINREVA